MLRLSILTLLTLCAFAGNSVLCRVALKDTAIDAASFTSIRLASGALVLWLIARARADARDGRGNWLSALALFAYAAPFSFAYEGLSAATGALLLFGAVQVTMIGAGLWRGERLQLLQWSGLSLALIGLVGLLLPGLTAPPLGAATMMLGAGVAWGLYSLRGRGAGDPTRVTAGNFARAAPMALALSLLTLPQLQLDTAGIGYAIASGAIASGMGYALWYSVLPSLQATHAATLQLSVPVIAALAGMLLLDEALTWRFTVASIAILGGIALVIARRGPRRS